MGQEIDLLINYPKSKKKFRGPSKRKKESDRAIARKFGRESFLMVKGNMDMADLLILQDFGNLSFRPSGITRFNQ